MNADGGTLRYVPECSQIDEALARLAEIVEMFPEVRNEVFVFLEGEPQIIKIDLDNSATASAGNLRVLLKPSDSLLSFMAALRARHG